MAIGALASAASGLNVQETKMQEIADNIANSETPAFKRKMLKIVNQGSQVVQSAGSPTSTEGTVNQIGTYIGMGARVSGITRVMEQGNPEKTDNQYDLMIDGQGYFTIELPNGQIGYTRDGSFTLNAERQIVTMQGFKVKPDLTIPVNTTSVDINGAGQVYAQVDGQSAAVLVGQLEIAVFPNPVGLDDSMGNNLAIETAASGPATTGAAGAVGFGQIMQFFLESSNVKPVVELTAMISTQRAYAMGTKSISAVQQMDQNLQQI
jgi:flagellar basal-body rod protein FlgG